MDEYRRIFFVCECTDISHQFALGYWPDESSDGNANDSDKKVFAEIMLNPSVGILRRALIALRYVFCPGKCKYGAFQEVVLGREHVEGLREILNYLEK